MSGINASTMKGYKKLLEHYFPSSKNTSTSVKLLACLTEAVSTWSTDGGVILIGPAGVPTLSILAQMGAGLPWDLRLTIGDDSPIAPCYSLGKNEISCDLPYETAPLLPGIKPASAACASIRVESSVHGVLLLWSNRKGHFHNVDLTALSLFAYYVAMLLEVDELGESLGDNLLIDPLTGIYNRRRFDYQLRYEVTRAKRYASNVSLAIFDIDQLEKYNRSCGHMLGNLALSDMASIFQKGTREVDFVSRIGSDEFALILPQTSSLGAAFLADRLRADVASYPFPENESSATLTITGGVASFPSSAVSDQELFVKAFKAMQLAKTEGGDVVKLWR